MLHTAASSCSALRKPNIQPSELIACCCAPDKLYHIKALPAVFISFGTLFTASPFTSMPIGNSTDFIANRASIISDIINQSSIHLWRRNVPDYILWPQLDHWGQSSRVARYHATNSTPSRTVGKSEVSRNGSKSRTGCGQEFNPE